MKSNVDKEKTNDNFEISSLVQSLWGSVKNIPKDVDYKKLIKEEIAKKVYKKIKTYNNCTPNKA